MWTRKTKWDNTNERITPCAWQVTAPPFCSPASCVDDPVSVDEQPIEAAEELLAHAQYDDTETKDPHGTRFKVSLDVEGDLSPMASVTVWIEGVATEKLLGGEVRVLLPTMAAMAHAGSDERPNYPLGKDLPVEESWDLPIMDAGDTWKESVSIRLPGKGYYHVAVDVEARGADDKWNPFVFDDGQGEAWLFVVDGGGFVTNEFDEKVFGDDLVPQPGPFRTKYESRTSGDAVGADMVAASAAGAPPYISLLVGYYHGGRFESAAGAEVQGMYLDVGDSYGNIIIREVPGSGFVTFPCPATENAHYISVSSQVPTTSEINANHYIGGIELDQSDCGDMFLMTVSDKWYMPWSNLKVAIPRVDNHLSRSRSRVNYKYSSSSGGGGYSRGTDRITFYRGGYFSLRVAGHEYGHALKNETLGGTWNASRCTARYRSSPKAETSYECAFKEGFADYAGSVAHGDDWQWEDFPDSITSGTPGKIEGSVAALFYDLMDSANEGDDETAYSAWDVTEAFRTCRVNRNSRRNNVSHFVWCLEDRVDATVHRDNFPGLSVPYNPRGYRRSSWDADDIRSTWLQNVGR